MCDLSPAGISDRWNGVASPDADRSDQVVFRRLSDGPRQARGFGQVSAARTRCGVSDGLDHGAQAAPWSERGSVASATRLSGSRRDLHWWPRQPEKPGRSTANPDKSLVVAAVEKVPAPKNRSGKHGHAVKRQHGFFAGDARI